MFKFRLKYEGKTVEVPLKYGLIRVRGRKIHKKRMNMNENEREELMEKING